MNEMMTHLFIIEEETPGNTTLKLTINMYFDFSLHLLAIKNIFHSLLFYIAATFLLLCKHPDYFVLCPDLL